MSWVCFIKATQVCFICLLMSLQQLLKNYEQKKRQREKKITGLRQQLQRSIQDVSIQALKLQNHKVNHIHKNQQAIEMKMRRQQELVADLRKNQEVWTSLYEQLNRALMQVGDLVHYAGYVEAEIGEMLGVGSVARYLEEAENDPVLAKQIKRVSSVGEAEIQRREDAQVYKQIVEQDEKYDSVI